MLTGKPLSIGAFLHVFARPIALTWALTLCETVLLALVPLFIGFAIDGLLESNAAPLLHVAAILAALIATGVVRRLYDTRVYGTIRLLSCKTLAARAGDAPVSVTNARMAMGRELVDFLEETVPHLLNAVVQIAVAIAILYAFHPVLALAAAGAGMLMLAAYGLSHRRFYRLNGDLNRQMEKQVGVLARGTPTSLMAHLGRLRRFEIRISDTEAFVFGAILAILLGFLVFNLWFAASNIEVTVGTLFAIISYSWEFAEAALTLPAALQNWSRLSEITRRINKPIQAGNPSKNRPSPPSARQP